MIPVAARPNPVLFAHRGGGAEAPENSWTAFRRAVAMGITHIETDVHLSRDGRVVVIHDPVLDRTYDISGTVGQHTASELAAARNAAGEAPPFLDDVLREFPDTYFNIDAKEDAVVEPLMDTLERHDAFGRVMIASFSQNRLDQVRRSFARELSTSLSSKEVASLVAASTLVVNPESLRVPGPFRSARAAQVPTHYGPVKVVTPRFVATAHTMGLAVHVWTVDESDEMARLLDMGVDGLITDRPTVAIEVLKARGQWG